MKKFLIIFNPTFSIKKFVIPVLLMIGVATISFAVSLKGNNRIASSNTEASTIQASEKSPSKVSEPDNQDTAILTPDFSFVHVLVDKSGNLVRVVPGDISESDVLSLIQ